MQAPTSKEHLYQANNQFGTELLGIQSSLGIYTVIGLNTKAIKSGQAFLGFVQKQSLGAVVLGLTKVFEREKEDDGKNPQYPLCSVSGVYRLVKKVQPQDMTAVQAFINKYSITASEDWISDVGQVLSAQQSWIRQHMRAINRVRNTKLAHSQQDTPTRTLPSIAAFQELLAFAFEFHVFVNEAFFNAQAYPILDDRHVAGSLLNLLRHAGMSGLVSKFEDI
jgi:hypothetical protein